MNPWKPALLRLKPFGREFDTDRRVESRSGGGTYIVNLHRYTCTCPDFRQRRAQRPVGDLGRSCKHLRDIVLSLDEDAFGDELTRVIFKSPHGPYDRIWFAPDSDGSVIALGLKDDGPWWNIFLKDGPDGPYNRYGYHPAEDRWSYDHPPANAAAVLDLARRIPGIN